MTSQDINDIIDQWWDKYNEQYHLHYHGREKNAIKASLNKVLDHWGYDYFAYEDIGIILHMLGNFYYEAHYA